MAAGSAAKTASQQPSRSEAARRMHKSGRIGKQVKERTEVREVAGAKDLVIEARTSETQCGRVSARPIKSRLRGRSSKTPAYGHRVAIGCEGCRRRRGSEMDTDCSGSRRHKPGDHGRADHPCADRSDAAAKDRS